ncbi:hypothetical protein WR25_22627 [Diploscapter pachys]|uniref:Ribosome maturation protein SBDS n=1 Tax=Diploscapter pachys TaxID=2018661 RepID=A0A2A2LR51_9BILA|nr:hypothetical protein WR25_22627 [Diploscapter pachys]
MIQMSKNIKTPTNQKLLTNVAVVRMKKVGKRFEIACYKNKVVNWRNKTEKDIDEVLQTHTVFSNVSKGQVAKKDELMAAFGTEDQLEICKIVRIFYICKLFVIIQILEKGDLQVSDKERAAATDQSLKEVSQLIASMVVNPETKRPIPPAMIDKALQEIHFSLKPNRSAKQQALEAIPKLRETMKIDRAKMRIRVSMPSKEAKQAHGRLKTLVEETEVEDWAEGGLEMVALIEPGNFRELDDLVRKEGKGHGRLEILSLKDVVDGIEIVFVSPFEEICLNVFGLDDRLLLGSGSHGRNHSRPVTLSACCTSISSMAVLLQCREMARAFASRSENRFDIKKKTYIKQLTDNARLIFLNAQFVEHCTDCGRIGTDSRLCLLLR